MNKGKLKKKRSFAYYESVEGWLFITPAILGAVIFLVIPFIVSIYLSFTQYSLIEPPKFVGFQNFQKLTSDTSFWKSLTNTIYFTLASIPIGLAFALILAIIMNHNIKGITFFRTAYFIPVITSWVAVGLIWRWLYNPEFGLINWILSLFGINGPNWLISTTWAMPAVIIVNVWKNLGFNTMIFLAGLQGIPEYLYEASKIDGANRWQQFRHITLPMVSPTTLFLTITSVINSFQVFDAIYNMTNGGPEESTMVIVYYLWENAFGFLKMGYAAAMAWVLFIIIFGLTIIQWRLSSKWVYTP